MQLYNTLTRRKEPFVPLQKGKATIYACGPTVYDFIHIGNARPLCVFDVLRRYLEWRGFEVCFVQNFTDIDDKLIRKANAEDATVQQIAERYIKEYWTDAGGLNAKPASVHPRATENIDAILSLIETLFEKGYAYATGGDVYFRAGSFDEYGKLSHQPLEELEAGARIDVSEQKENPMDFCLWKAAKPGEPAWPSPWGEGRPGWHIECSAMACRYLGQTIDIHCGGQDLIFPHHENEIAQSECANGCTFARYWLHNGYINVDNRKMSKSLGNFFTVRQVAQEYGYAAIRYFLIASHYRSPINYNAEVLEQAQNALGRLARCKENLAFALQNAPAGGEVPAFLSRWEQKFVEAMEDDLNTADALAALFNLLRDINSLLRENPGRDALEASSSLFDTLCDVLGLAFEQAQALDEEVEKLIDQRAQARKARDFATADRIRDTLKDMGIQLEDTPQGVKWSRL